MTKPFVEHPSGEFESAVDAMEAAIARLRALPDWNDWITFCAQGMGHRVDSYHLAKIRMWRDELEITASLDVRAVIREAGVSRSSLIQAGANYSVAGASPAEAARVMRRTWPLRTDPDRRGPIFQLQ